MAMHDVNQQDAQRHECFLCILDLQKKSCYKAQIEGRIVAVYEGQFEGKKIPIVTLDTGITHVEILLDPDYYRSLISELKARGDILGSYSLTLRIYHLPTAPITLESNGRTRSYYKTNAYTLAVLEPDILFNITDLNQAEYCSRQYILNRLVPSTTSPATIRGNLVHYCFKELLKAHDREKFNARDGKQSETPLATLHHHLEQALELNSIEMALANVSPEAMRTEVTPHLESLAYWYQSERNTLWNIPAISADAQEEETGNQVRAETFLLAPEIGLRGRLDLFWQQSGQQRLLELKTGGASGALPKRDHRWQVLGYHALLTVRRDSQMKRAFATLLYSGTPGNAQAFGIRPTIRDIQRVNETRNILALSRVTGTPPSPPGASRCGKCAMLERCQHVSALLKWQPPEPDPQILAKYSHTRPANTFETITQGNGRSSFSSTPEDQEFFARYYALLQMEERASEQQQALLWQLPVTERIERGTAITGLDIADQPIVDKDGWKLVFNCNNTSELREGDEILLSNGNPISGEVVTGTIVGISSEQVTVWTREKIEHPVLIDRYDNDLVHVRTLQNLLRWQQADAHQRDLVAGRVRPRFIDGHVPPRPDFNAEQNLAIERAMQMQDYLLIHGPPGTGKTSVIAEIVKHLIQQGQRVMLVAFTNQAVDNMLKRLDKEGFHRYLRLGHERSVNESVHPRLLKELASVGAVGEASYQDIIHDILYSTPVVASTTATWSSDKYNARSAELESDPLKHSGLSFDVAIIDEAGQLTIPAILGALRLARRFILVGDEKQLPPLVLSKDAAEAGLADSLFSVLKGLDEKYMQDYPLAISACVSLCTQYRMNKWIANFSSTVFYDKQLVAHKSIANHILAYTRKNVDALQALANTAKQNQAIIRALEPQYPLVFLDVYDEYSESAVVEGKQSHAEARVVRAIVANLLAHGVDIQDIGIIAPYRAQVANIRRHLFSADPVYDWQGLPSNAPISVDTVDRFQGGERLIIIISFATTREPSIESQRYTFLTNPNRLNVALTRAQRKLILVGCVPALEHLPTFSRLITYCRSMNTLVDYQANARSC
ncbi:MAG TPA: AAA domain-containing protein [Ktedonobacteraceae bacterium]|jgi:DNA replication ATP-dependent helicase Dna2